MMNKNPFAIEKKSDDQIQEEFDNINSQRIKKAMRLKLVRQQELLDIVQDRELTDEIKASKIADMTVDDFLEATAPQIMEQTLSLLREFKLLEENALGNVILDQRGNAIAQFNEESVYYPTLIDEDGNESKGMPILHPTISSGLMLNEADRFEVHKLKHLNPVYGFNSDIEVSYSRLKELIFLDLQKAGIEIKPNDGPIYTEIIGRETKVTIFGKNRNPAFSREPIWSKKFVSTLSGKKKIEIVDFQKVDDELERWYEITYRSI